MSEANIAPILVLGAGIGGLATAWACSQQKIPTVIWEKGSDFKELGAGIQLGPNVTKVLAQLGLAQELQSLASVPEKLVFYSARNDARIYQRALGHEMQQQFAAPYYTIARADLHELLLAKVQKNPYCQIHTDHSLESLAWDAQNPTLVKAQTSQGKSLSALAVVAADGARSFTRDYFYPHQELNFTGQIAYRSLLDFQSVQPSQLLQQVSVWLGDQVHVVAYPVLQGRYLNLVVITEEKHLQPEMQLWHKKFQPSLPRKLLEQVQKNPTLLGLFQSIESWRYWLLFDRPPLNAAQLMTGAATTVAHLNTLGGKVALLGDAAHPMLPFLAQGAAMAIEDAYRLSLELATHFNPTSRSDANSVDQALRHYANARWQRVAKVQSMARRNAKIFHWHGPMAYLRNLGLTTVGQALTQMNWLYGYDMDQPPNIT